MDYENKRALSILIIEALRYWEEEIGLELSPANEAEIANDIVRRMEEKGYNWMKEED